jgi:large subunit ribosomal protein L22
MDVIAITKFARMSPLKARALARSVQGLAVGEALKITQFTRGKAALLVGKTLKSAIANAENNAKLSVDDLTVKVAVIEEGPRLRRFWPRARGGASPILKRMSHVRIVLTDGKQEEDAG